MQNENKSRILDTLQGKETAGIPIWGPNIMEHSVLELLDGSGRRYVDDPYGVYIGALQKIGVDMVDQFIPTNPLSMGSGGYDGPSGEHNAPDSGIVLNGITIDSPEAVAEHMEAVLIPSIEAKIRDFSEGEIVGRVVEDESMAQQMLGPCIQKLGYGHLVFPTLEYFRYGYVNYFMAYAIYPEIIDRLFAAQADYAVLHNRAAVKAYLSTGRPRYTRLDHDMADSRGLLVSLSSLERSWLGSFRRSIEPAVEAGFRLLWHCDGNLMQLLPRLIECGVNGFQGFQYEDGMDYEKICAWKDRDGGDLVIIGGISVTRELPMGTPADVKRQLEFLVEHGPRNGLILGFSSSCAPGTPVENILTAVEGLQYYQKYGWLKGR